MTNYKTERAYRLHVAEYQRKLARRRRRRLKKLGVCINAIAHGPPVRGCVKCARCLAAHRLSR